VSHDDLRGSLRYSAIHGCFSCTRARPADSLKVDVSSPYSALESLLTTLSSILTAELTLLNSRADTLISDLAEDITREELNRLLSLRSAVGECLSRCIGVKRGIDRLLSEDADLAASYLTAAATNTPRTTEDHEELELLLESYSQRFEGLITGASSALVSRGLLMRRCDLDLNPQTRPLPCSLRLANVCRPGSNPIKMLSNYPSLPHGTISSCLTSNYHCVPSD
jgi:hypothetical protein